MEMPRVAKNPGRKSQGEPFPQIPLNKTGVELTDQKMGKSC